MAPKYTSCSDLPCWDTPSTGWYLADGSQEGKGLVDALQGFPGRPGIPHLGLSPLPCPERKNGVVYADYDLAMDDGGTLVDALRERVEAIDPWRMPEIRDLLEAIGPRNRVYLRMYLMHSGATTEAAASAGHPEYTQSQVSQGFKTAVAVIRRVRVLKGIRGLSPVEHALLASFIARGSGTAIAQAIGHRPGTVSKRLRGLQARIGALYGLGSPEYGACSFTNPLYINYGWTPGYKQWCTDDILADIRIKETQDSLSDMLLE